MAQFTTNGGTFTCKRIGMTWNEDGSFVAVYRYTNTATGKTRMMRTITVPANHASPIVDQDQTQLSAQVPAALGTGIDTFNTQMDSMETTAAGSGKFDL